MWASSSITNAVMQAAVNQEFFRLVFSGGFATVGESVAAAKAVVTDRDVRRSWIFFGDPAMRLKGVPQATDGLDRLTSTPTSGPVRAALNDTDSDTDAAPSQSDDAGTTGEPETADGFVQHLVDFDGDGRDGLFVYDPETGAWSRYLTGDSKPNDTVDLVEESGTWAPGLSIVGRP